MSAPRLGLVRHGRTWVLYLCAAAYLAASLGVLPSAALLRKWGVLSAGASLDFPCAEHDCGCLSAETCWHGCCCYTLEERREWAVAHGAFVPRWAMAVRAPGDAHSSSCCAHGDGRAAEPARGRWARVMSGLSCRGVQPWLFTGLPPTSMDETVCLVLGRDAARLEKAEPTLLGQHSLDPPSPPPRHG